MTRQVVTTNEIAPAVGPFSAAVHSGEFLILSGQVALDPVTAKLVDGDVAKQTEQIFRNIIAVLRAGGKSLSNVVKTNVFLTDMKDFAAMNEVYGRHFDAPYPARTTVAVAALPVGAKVEIEVLAR